MLDLSFDQLSFSLFDILLLMGSAQSLYIIVYLLFRSGRISRGGVPMAYFLNMAALFSLMFFETRLDDLSHSISVVKWFLWMLQPLLSCLLIVQVAQIYKVPALKQYWVFLPLLVAYIAVTAYFENNLGEEECISLLNCQSYMNWLWLAGIVAVSVALLSVWFNRHIFSDLLREKNHKERYWLILALIFINAACIATMLLLLGLDGLVDHGVDRILILFALALVYLSGTSLFRIYPQAVHVAVSSAVVKKPKLSIEEIALAEKLEDLVFTQKVYHEQAYSRTDMARECGVPEAMLSKVISVHFSKSFPQLLNHCRVEDAKLLLRQTSEPVKVVGEEVGFNSLPSFNRVFKNLVGVSPKSYRDGAI